MNSSQHAARHPPPRHPLTASIQNDSVTTHLHATGHARTAATTLLLHPLPPNVANDEEKNVNATPPLPPLATNSVVRNLATTNTNPPKNLVTTHPPTPHPTATNKCTTQRDARSNATWDQMEQHVEDVRYRVRIMFLILNVVAVVVSIMGLMSAVL